MSSLSSLSVVTEKVKYTQGFRESHIMSRAEGAKCLKHLPVPQSSEKNLVFGMLKPKLTRDWNAEASTATTEAANVSPLMSLHFAASLLVY